MGRRKTPDEVEIQELKVVNTALKRQVAKLQKQIARLTQTETRVEEAEEIVPEKPVKGGCLQCGGAVKSMKLPSGKIFKVCKDCEHKERT
jgi:Zn finger protein HypA/HybF involved in hydrogenase expression